MTENGELIRQTREARGLSQKALADAVGTKQQTIDKIESGIIKHSRFLALIYETLGLRPDTAAVQLSGGKTWSIPPGSSLVGNRDLPVYGAAEGGKGQLIVTTEPVDWELRPAPLANAKGAYGLIVTGDSMVPEFEPGDIALVNPNLPAIRDVSCIFYAESPTAEVRAVVKRLVRVTAESWVVCQWNPPEGQKREITLPRREWTKCHRIVGKYSRR